MVLASVIVMLKGGSRDLYQCDSITVGEDSVMLRARTSPALICSALIFCLLASCSEGPRVPEYLRAFTEVDDIAPDISKVKIAEVQVDSQLDEMEEAEKEHIADRLRKLAEEALGEAGYEVVLTAADAELIITYTEMTKTDYHYTGNPGRLKAEGSPVRAQVPTLDITVALVERKHMEVFYRTFDLPLPASVPEGLSAVDAVEEEIMESFRRTLRPSQWD